MDPVTLAVSLLGASAEIAKLAAAAIEAAKADDDAKALELLDQAVTKQEAGISAARAELEAVKQRVAARIDAKFDTSGTPAP
jgi:ketopantoate hydroxymethyltransferase